MKIFRIVMVVLGLLVAGVATDANLTDAAVSVETETDTAAISPVALDRQDSIGQLIQPKGCWTYPDAKPVPCPPEKCRLSVETFGTVIGEDDSTGTLFYNFDPNYRITVSDCRARGIEVWLGDIYMIDNGPAPTLSFDGLVGVCPNDPYGYVIKVLGLDGSVIYSTELLLGDEEGKCPPDSPKP